VRLFGEHSLRRTAIADEPLSDSGSANGTLYDKLKRYGFT
jgi:hypothetical protein